MIPTGWWLAASQLYFLQGTIVRRVSRWFTRMTPRGWGQGGADMHSWMAVRLCCSADRAEFQ
jgi:hypothetical protein